jgi:subtilisin family serine protease
MAQQGLILIAAAGNGGPEAKAAYPAAYADVIAVSAHDRVDNRYAHANRGAYIALAAPGVDILVPTVGGTHAFMSGTSMAAAHVTGIVALILERAERLNHSRILAVLKKTAEDLGEPGPDEDFGAGRAHALAAVQEVLSSSEHAGEVQ